MASQFLKRILRAAVFTLPLLHESSLFADATPRDWKISADDDILNRRCDPELKIDDEISRQHIDWLINCGHFRASYRRYFNYRLDYETVEWIPLRHPRHPLLAREGSDESWQPDLSTCDMPENVIFVGTCFAR